MVSTWSRKHLTRLMAEESDLGQNETEKETAILNTDRQMSVDTKKSDSQVIEQNIPNWIPKKYMIWSPH